MKRFKNILFVVDPQRGCQAALEHAVALAESNHARLTLADVIVPNRLALLTSGEASPIQALQDALMTNRAARLSDMVRSFRDRLPIMSQVLIGTPYLEIVRAVLAQEHDLVIRPPEDVTWLDTMLGSDDMNLLRQCPCPVWLTKCHAGRSFRRILAAIDVTAADGGEDETRRELNRRILELAASLAFSESAELHVAYVWEALGEELMRGTMLSIPEEQITAYVSSVHARCAHALEALVTEVLGGLGAPPPAERKPKLHLPRGAARKKIPALAERLGADLIVMGTLARCGIPGLIMGNTAETILRQVDCSVLAIKPVGFTSSIQASA